jgi:23S rRNA maturation mini-RNase III
VTPTLRSLWEGQYVLLFNACLDREPHETRKTRIRLAFEGDALYEECVRYAKFLRAEATFLDDAVPSYYSQDLSSNWIRFAAPEKRLARTGPFIEQVIASLRTRKQDIRIFDAATGVGFETVYLLKAGYAVQANEIEDLDRDHQSGQFDVVLVLGNGLCHLQTVAEVSAALRQFNDDPDRVMYCGEDVISAPLNRRGDRIEFAFWEIEPLPSGIRAARRELGSLSVFAFPEGLIRRCLGNVGFDTIETYCDLGRCDEGGGRAASHGQHCAPDALRGGSSSVQPQKRLAHRGARQSRGFHRGSILSASDLSAPQTTE